MLRLTEQDSPEPRDGDRVLIELLGSVLSKIPVVSRHEELSAPLKRKAARFPASETNRETLLHT